MTLNASNAQAQVAGPGPSIILTGTPAAVNSRTAFDVMVTFSEDVTGFDALDITEVVNATVTVTPVSGSASDYTLTVTPDGGGDIEFSIRPGAAQDAAGNPSVGSETRTVVYDTTDPTVLFSNVPTAPLTDMNPFFVTATFDEPVFGFGAETTDVMATNATVTVSGTGTTYTLTVTPDGMGYIILMIPANAAQDVAGNDSAASTAVTVRVNAPMVMLSGAPATVNTTTTPFTVTATFSQSVNGFDDDDVRVANANVTTITGSGTTYMLSVTPDGRGDITLSVEANVATGAGSGYGNRASNTVNVRYTDTTAPTVQLAGAPTGALTSAPVANTSPFDVTATFSEPVNGFMASDVDVTNATVAVSGAGPVYTLTVTPTTEGVITLSIPADEVRDDAGNGNDASNTVSVTYDATAPTVFLGQTLTRGQVIPIPDSVNNTNPFFVTATFSEDVTGFVPAGVPGVSVPGVLATNATVTGERVSDSVYILTVTPNANGDISLAVMANAAQDDARNNNAASSTVNVRYTGPVVDATRPTVMLTAAPRAVTTANPFDVTATFSEAVTGFTAEDVMATNATVAVSGTGPVYTLTVTPTVTPANGVEITLSIPADRVNDTATPPIGNTASNTVRVHYDVTAPTVAFSNLQVQAGSFSTSGPFNMTATFSEDVTGFDTSDITPENATVTVTPVSRSEYTLTVTPDGLGDIISLFIMEDAVRDAAGNMNAISNSVRVEYTGTLTDMTRPTVELSGAPAAANNSAFTVTATFSEPVFGFRAADVVASNATTVTVTPALSPGMSGEVFTLEVTPNGNGDIELTIPRNRVEDALVAGNGNDASNTVRVVYDVTAPTVRLSGEPGLGVSVDTTPFDVTATFDKPVTGFVAGNVTAINATVAVTPVSARVYTLTVTPNGIGAIALTIPAGAASDAAGNMNTAPSNMVNVTFSATNPTNFPDISVAFSGNTIPHNAMYDQPGPITVGIENSLTYTIQNIMSPTSMGVLNVTGVTVDSTTNVRDVSLSDTTFRVASPGVAQLTVSFTPERLGPYAFRVTLASNDRDEASYEFMIRGTVTEPDISVVGRNNITINNGGTETLPSTIVAGTRNTIQYTVSNSGDAALNVTGFTVSGERNIPTGTVSVTPPSLSIPANQSATFTLAYTPTNAGTYEFDVALASNDPDANPYTITVAGTARGAPGVPDVTGPTVELTGAPETVTTGAPFDVTATFSEIVDGFGSEPAADVSATNATVRVTRDPEGSGRVYTLTVTPTMEDTITLEIPENAAEDRSVNRNGNAASNTVSVLYDATVPTVELAAPAAVNSNDSFNVTVRFSEPVAEFVTDDVTVTGATVSISGSGPLYTLAVEPNGNADNITLSIAAGAVQDLAGNMNTASNDVTVRYDTTVPTVRLTGAPTTPVNGMFELRAIFSEPVTGFAMEHLSVTNASVTISGVGPVYTLEVMPIIDGDVTISIPAGVTTDLGGNSNTASDVVSVILNRTVPTVMLVSSTTSVSNNDPFDVTATFTFGGGNPPVASSLTADDVEVTNASVMITSVEELASSVPQTIYTTIYTLRVTPDGQGDISLMVRANAVSDAAGNGNTASNTVNVAYPSLPDLPDIAVLSGANPLNEGATNNLSGTFTPGTLSRMSYTIRNSGGAALNVTGITVSNQMNISGSVSVTPASLPVAPNSQGTFQVEFTPDVAGRFSFDISLASDDPHMSPFNFTVAGQTIAPDFDVSSGTSPISEGGRDDQPANVVEGAEQTVTYTVSNTGVIDLNVTAITVSNETNVNGSVTVTPTTFTVTPSGRGMFTVRYTPTNAGDFSFDISLARDDSDASAFGFTVFGTARPDPNVTDTVAPGVTLMGAPSAVNTDAAFTVMARFSEPVSGFGDVPADVNVMVTNATVTTVTAVNTQDYTLRVTPDGTQGDISLSIPMDAASDGAANGNTASNTVNVAYDTDGPTVTLTGAPAATNGTAFDVTVTFSEDVTGFEASDITPVNATVTVTPVSGSEYTLTVTPNITGGDITLMVPVNSVQDAAGNGNTPSVLPMFVRYDSMAPTVTLTRAPDLMTTAGAFDVTATFSEAVPGFEAADVTVTNDATVAISGMGPIYTLMVTPTTEGEITLSIAAGVTQDAAGNDNAASNAVSVTYDATVPTVTLSGAPEAVNSRNPFNVTAEFSEVVTGLEDADFSAAGVVTGATVTVASGSGTTYILTVTPNGQGNISFTIPAGAAQDDAGNDNEASSTVNVAYDGDAPTITLEDVPDTVNSDNVFNVTATFSESVTGFDAGDVRVTNATVAVTGSGTDYVLAFTPDGGGGDIRFSIAADAARDAADNGSAEVAEDTIIYDATAPMVMMANAPAEVISLNAFEVTVTFDEPVTGFAADHVMATNASVTSFTEVSDMVYTVGLTPNGQGSNIILSIPADSFMDAADNPNAAITLATVPYNPPAETIRPTVTLSGAPDTVNTNDPFDVTVTFSELVTVLVAGDVMVPNQNATVSLSGSGTIYTLTVTPTTEGVITLSIPAGATRDAAGNDNVASTVSVIYDETMPTVTMAGAPTTPVGSLEAFTVTATFSEDVTGFEVSNITSVNATVTGTRDSATQYTLTVTPDGRGDIELRIPAGSFIDVAGNPNAAITLATVTYNRPTETDPPTVVLSGAPAAVNSDAAFTVTAEFDELVTELMAGDVRVLNATVSLTGRSLTSRSATYTLEVTPDGSRADVTLWIPAGVARDAAGNGNEESNRVNVLYDTVLPGVTLSDAPPAVNSTDPFTVTATFSESVTGFAADDVDATNATVAISGTGPAYTLAVTPTSEGEVTLRIEANAAQDAAGNMNTASNTVTVAVRAQDPILRPIGSHVESRAHALLTNQPRLSGFLKQGASGSDAEVTRFNLNVTNSRFSLDGGFVRNGFWGEITGSRVSNDGSNTDYVFGAVGAHRQFSEHLLAGVMLQFDMSDSNLDGNSGSIDGQGWLVGPYFAARNADQPLYFEGRLLYGQTDNDIRFTDPAARLGERRGSFDTTRWLAQLRMEGEWALGEGEDDARLIPYADVSWTEDDAKGFTDSLGYAVRGQTVSLGQLELGSNIEVPLDVQQGSLMFTGGLAAVWSHTSGDFINDRSQGRGRAELGLSYQMDERTQLELDGYYDGIGASGFEAYGLSVSAEFRF